MNEQILTQDEVDALLQGISGESDSLEPEAPQADGVRSYDLANQERMVRERMPTLEIIGERFAKNIRIGLFDFIRKSPEVSIGDDASAEVQRLPARDRGADQLQHRLVQAAARPRA